MRHGFQLRKQVNCVGMMALVATVVVNSAVRAQQPTVVATHPQAESNPKLTFQYLFFWKENDTRTQSVLDATQKEIAKLGAGVTLKQIGIKDAANIEIVELYGVSRAPMPLVLCTASNGAVTKAFVPPFPADQLHEGMVSRGTADSLKALQENKLVVLCAMSSDTASSQKMLSNARALKADQRFGMSIEVVALDVRDPDEASLLAGVKLDSSMTQPTVVILAPPGKQLATITGMVTTEQIAEKLVAAQSTCCPGGKCGPGGQCGPASQVEQQKK